MPLRKLISLLITIHSLGSTLAQNQLIIQLHKGQEITNLPTINKHHKNKEALLQSKQLSAQLNIWLFRFDNTITNANILLDKIKNNPSVKDVSFNEAVKHRALPNDDFFSEQWQYENRGISRVWDADIDATDAWQITTGGTTATGEEIVVAILDGGVFLQHPDLKDNFWVNQNEIPNNGFTDDYYGWNFNKNNNDISNGEEGHWHGSPVAGIIGAKGNNGTGVSGVNCIVGDLPTTCSSDFLISVTNTNSKDNKMQLAAYEKKHIDLGAPGSGVYTIKNSGGYGSFDGTSAVSPHVAGAVALLYSTPIPAFMEDAQSNPAQQALLVKDFILNGTDLLPDLQNKSITGGRLNLYKSLLELYQYYNLVRQKITLHLH